MKKHGLLLLVLFALAPILAHAAPAVSISLNPATGVAPYTSTLTWSVTGAASCTASDAWTGTKSLTGTQTVTITAATKYTLTCLASDGQTTTTWTAPTTNTDGSTITDLAGYNLYRGTTATNLTRLKSFGPTVVSYQDTNLAPGQYYYALTSVNAASLESVQGRSSPYPVVVTGSSTSASANAGIQSVPNPPSGVQTVTVNVNVTVTTP